MFFGVSVYGTDKQHRKTLQTDDALFAAKKAGPGRVAVT